MMAEHPNSNLPQDPDYWETLARRIREDAIRPLAAYAGIQDAWYDVLSQRAEWLMAASAAAMLILWLSLPASDSVAFRWMERSLEPNGVAGSLMVGSSPPSVDRLMVQFQPVSSAEARR